MLCLWSFHCLPKQPTSTQATFKFLIQVVFLWVYHNFLNTCLFNFMVYQEFILLLIHMNLMHLHQEANQLHTFKVHPTLDQVLLPSPLVHPSLVLAFQHSPLMCPTLCLFHHMHVLVSLHSSLWSKHTQRTHKCYFSLILHVFFSQK